MRGEILKATFFQKMIFVAAALFCFANFSCAKNSPIKENKNLPRKNLTIKTLTGETVSILAEIASTDESRAAGFMFRKKIPDGTGMLFVYESDGALSFWMKNTPHPLSIAYVDYKGRIKDIFDMKPYDLNSVASSGFVRYALEVPQGYFDRAGIRTGDFLELDFLD